MFLFDRQRHRRARIAAVLTTAALAVVGCSQTPPQTSAPAAGGGQAANSKIFMAPKFTGLAYFEVAKEGGEKAAQDLGIDFQYIGSDKPDATIDAGAAGKYTVGKDGEVQYNKPLMFTKDNIDSFNY